MKTPSPSPAGQAAFVEAALRQAHADMLLDDRFDEPIVARVKRGLDTACWVFDPSVGHRIFVGDSCLDRARTDLSEAQRREYVSKFAHHERGHAMYTVRDRARVERWLSDADVPFGLYNLVEDARIENRYVRESAATFTFDWTRYEPVEARSLTSTPGTCTAAHVVQCAFFNMIQTEGDIDLVKGLYPPEWAGVVKEAIAFHEAAVAASDSREAIEVAARMLKAHPQLRQAAAGRCGLALGMSMQGPEGAASLAEFLRDENDSKPIEAPGRSPTRSRGRSRSSNQDTSADLLSPTPVHALDTARIGRLADRLCGLSTRRDPVADVGTSPGSRVSMRHALRGQARWHVRAEPARPRRVRRLLLVGDVSGSMQGAPIQALALLTAALSEAQRRGLLCGDVVLSTTHPNGRSRWQHRPLPWTLDEAARIVPHDSEGLTQTLRHHDHLVEAADLVIVLTDGHIGGASIPHAQYRRRGKCVVGAYVIEDGVDPEGVIEKLSEHFDRLLVRGSVENLVNALVMEPMR